MESQYPRNMYRPKRSSTFTSSGIKEGITMSVTAPSNGLSSYWEVENNPWIRRETDESPNHPNSLVNTREYEMQVLLCRNCQQSACASSSTPATAKTNRNNLTLSMEIKAHFLRFCESTSLRGVPRIVKAKEKKRKLLWIFFVLIFFIGCITCVVMIVRQYIRADVIHQPVTLTHKPRSFPSFTICNTRPISQRGYTLLKKKELMNQVEYTKSLKSNLKLKDKEYNFTVMDRKYLSMSMSMTAFLQALPKEVKYQSLGHAQDEIIVNCGAVLVEGNFNIIKPCNVIGNWTKIFNEQFLNCYTFTVNNKSLSRTTKNINLMVYLGERSKSCGDCVRTPESQVDGVRVQLHETSTYPYVNEGGVYLSPGTLTEIQFVTKQWSMMQPPHGNCKKSQRKTITLNKNQFRFTNAACKEVAIQRKIADNCNCTEFEKPSTQQNAHMHDGKQYCRKPLISAFKDGTNSPNLTREYLYREYIHTIACASTIKTKYQNDNLGCFSPCTYYTYDTSTSSTKWPTKSYHENFFGVLNKCKVDRLCDLCIVYLNYTKLLRKHEREPFATRCCDIARNSTRPASKAAKHILEIEEMYNIVLSKKALLSTNDSKIDTFMKRMLLTEYISNHFLAIQISRSNFDIIYIEEKAVISLTSLFSQVGGLLSIWVGLTFVCIVEIIELCLNVVETVSNKKK